jgi:hypothetical protein
MQLDRDFVVSNVRFDRIDKTHVIVSLEPIEEPKPAEEPAELNPFDVKNMAKVIGQSIGQPPKTKEHTDMEIAMPFTDYKQNPLLIGAKVKLSIEVLTSDGV